MTSLRLLLLSLLSTSWCVAADVIPADITKMEWKLTTMRRYFSQVWNDFFLNDSIRLYIPPKIVAYSKTSQNACGVLPSWNASFCDRENTIYYDRIFLANEMNPAMAVFVPTGGEDGGDWNFCAAAIFPVQVRLFASHICSMGCLPARRFIKI